MNDLTAESASLRIDYGKRSLWKLWWTIRRQSPPRGHKRPAPIEPLEVRTLLTANTASLGDIGTNALTVVPEGLLIYYAYPSGINGTFSVNGAAAEFAKYSFVVLGGGLEQTGHADHANTAAILNHPATANTTFFGYVDLGVSTSNFTTAEIHQRIDAWQVTGADAIFLDDYGYDFGVSRARQNDAVDYAHSLGLPVVANGFFINEVFGNQVDPQYNPGGAAPSLQATDYYLYESYQITEGSFVGGSTWRAKADALAAVRTTLPIKVLAVTTTLSATFDQSQFDYAYWSAAMDGYSAFGWGEPSFSSSTASAPFRSRPATDPGSAYSSPIGGDSSLYTRETNLGRITVNPTAHQAGFNELDFGDAPELVSSPAPGSYQTKLSSNGPRHRIGGPRLGTQVDFESDAVLYNEDKIDTGYGTGDNIYGADEDGVTFTSFMQPSPTVATSATVTVNAQNTNGNARLDAWVDFNRDGDFSDAGEQIFQNRSLAEGNNALTFAVPAGAANGKSFARFRVSTAGNLAPTGLANDGEVEDHAVVLGSNATLQVIENAILAHRFPNGVLRSSNGVSFYQRDNGHAWYILDPYFSSFAVRALLAGPNLGTADKYGVAENHLAFWLSHVQGNGSLPRLIVDDNFQFLTTAVESTFDDPMTGLPVVFDPAKIGADADDSALSMILSVAADYATHGGSTSFLNSQRTALESIATTLVSLIEADNLPTPFIDPARNYFIKQTQDCAEVLQALRQFAALERDVFHDPQQAAFYTARADATAPAIEQSLYDSGTGLYRQYQGASTPDLNVWYPIVLDQVWPIITGVVPANSARARQLLDAVYGVWDGSPQLNWTMRTDSASLAWAAIRAGDKTLAAAAVQHVLPWALQNTPANPAVPMTVADFGFLLQSLLPSLAGPNATTFTENHPPLSINPTLIVSDVDTATLASATIRITNFVPGEDELSFTGNGATMGNIALASNINGTLMLTSAGATATLSQWQSALRSVQYSNSSNFPNPTKRAVTFTIDDGVASSNTITSTISVIDANDAPALGGVMASQPVNDDSIISPFAGSTVTDPDNQNMLAKVTISNGVVRGDFTAASTTGWTRTVVGNDIVYSRFYNPQANIGSVVQTAIRALVFVPRANAIKPNTTELTDITVFVNDGLANTSATTRLVITSVNNAPTIGGPSNAVAVNDNGTVNPFPMLLVSDADHQEMLISVTILNGKYRGDFTNATSSGWTVRYTTGNDITYKRYFSPGPNVGASAQAAFRTLVFQPRTNAIKPGTTEATAFQVTASDGVAPAVLGTGTLVTTTSINNAPGLSGTVAGQTVNDNATKAVFSSLVVTDPDTQEMLARVTINGGTTRGDFVAASTVGWTRSVSGGNILYNRYFSPLTNIGATVQTAIRALVYQPRTNVPIGTTETTTFAVFVNDGIANATDSTTSVMTTGVAPRPVPAVAVTAPRFLDNDIATLVVPSVQLSGPTPSERVSRKQR